MWAMATVDCINKIAFPWGPVTQLHKLLPMSDGEIFVIVYTRFKWNGHIKLGLFKEAHGLPQVFDQK